MNNPGLMNHEKNFRLIRPYGSRAPTTFKLEGEVISLSGSSQGEVGETSGRS